MELKKLESVTLTQGFGSAAADGLVNRVVKCVWSDGRASDFVFVGERPLYVGNMVLPEKYGSDAAACEKFKTAAQAAVDSGNLHVYGHLVSVAEATDNEHTKVKNLVNGHIIEVFPRAWVSDDHKAVVDQVRRSLAKSIGKKMSFED